MGEATTQAIVCDSWCDPPFGIWHPHDKNQTDKRQETDGCVGGISHCVYYCVYEYEYMNGSISISDCSVVFSPFGGIGLRRLPPFSSFVVLFRSPQQSTLSRLLSLSLFECERVSCVITSHTHRQGYKNTSQFTPIRFHKRTLRFAD